MGLALTRYIKSGGTLIAADGSVANTIPSKVVLVRRMNSIVVPIPGEQHFGMPMGPEAVEFTVTFPWDMYSPPCAGKTYAQSLKQWTCNSIYAATPNGSLVNDIQTGYYIAKTISHERKAPGVHGESGVSYPRWVVTIQLMKLRNSDVSDCPTFTDYTSSSPYTGGNTTPYFKMTNILDDSSITALPSSIKVTHSGQAQAFALYDEEALNILPPLGNVGPVIDIEFRISSNTDFNTVKLWAATRSTVIKVDQRQYDEFDIDNEPTYHSKWIVSALNWDRDVASGGAYATAGSVNRRITMSLTRYWGYELMI